MRTINKQFGYISYYKINKRHTIAREIFWVKGKDRSNNNKNDTNTNTNVITE